MFEKPTPPVVIIHLAWSTLLSRACWLIFSGHTYLHVGRRQPRANGGPGKSGLKLRLLPVPELSQGRDRGH